MTRSVSVSGVFRKLPEKRYTTKSPGTRAPSASGVLGASVAAASLLAAFAGASTVAGEGTVGACGAERAPQPVAKIEAVAMVRRMRFMGNPGIGDYSPGPN